MIKPRQSLTEKQKINVGIIGFGEAGSAIGAGLSGAECLVYTYDPAFFTDKTSAALRVRAETDDIKVVNTPKELAETCDILICTVVAAVAVKVARDVVPFLTPRHIYMDLNSVSPMTKQQIAEVLSPSAALFVEGAIMTNVAKKRHQVPIFACGPGVHDLKCRMANTGMSIENLGLTLGRASAIKMFRSIMVKGLEALFLECLLAAAEYNVGDKVLEMVQEGYPGLDWKQLASQLTGRTAEHGSRRADEMFEVAATLRAMQIEPFMAEAAARRISASGMALQGHFDRAPSSYVEVIGAVRSAGIKPTSSQTV